MENYINIDKNMIVHATVGDAALVWHDVRQAPFSLHGFYEPQSEPFFRRVPAAVADATSEGVSRLSEESTGGRVRFSTDSPLIAIRAKFRVVGRSSHLTLISTAGFDLYTETEFGSRFITEFRMPLNMTDYYEQIATLGESKMRSYTIHFPVHSVVESLEVGLAPDAALGAGLPYRNIDPVLIYGSSIVHGTAATRPGLTYPAILSREWNIDFKNLGFSGMAKGEEALARWMAQEPMSIFICDYDHNAPSPEYLAQTHFRLYEIIREAKPYVPYIMISRPNFLTSPKIAEEVLQRRDVVMSSYLKARGQGDKNVYFIDGMSFFTEPHSYDFVVDYTHPGDAGFIRMADSIGTTVRYILENK